MKSLLLDGSWTAVNTRLGDSYPVHVPGFVQKDLIEQGVLPNEYDTLLEPKVEWVEYDEWTYKRTFKLDEELLQSEALDLLFEGIDTYAEITLNGTVIGHTDNMFVPRRFSIQGIAKTDNELVVRISSPTETLLEKERGFGEQLQLWNGIPARLFGRKAQYGYGWDWGPRLVTVGIHKSVRVEGYAGCYGGTFAYNTGHISKDKALLNANVTIVNARGAEADAVMEYRVYDGDAVVFEKREEVKLHEGKHTYPAGLEIANPKLWYPAGYGEQPLYRLEVTVSAGKDSFTKSCTAGIRDVKISQPYDKQGRKFVFEINGVPILCKGVNWIPLTLYPNLDSAEDYRREIDGIVKANMNMIRIWGGGTYENHDFFDECDRLGVMVWQDFMFACGDYPDDDAFCELVREEAEHVIDEFGFHPSIVLWCGNNENQHFIVQSKAHRKHGYGEKLYFEVLDEACAKDKLRPYWPTSPYDLTVDSSANNEDYGDQHYWHVWGRTEPYESYGKVNGRFISEFGMQSYPSMRVMNAVDPEANLRDPKFDAMQKAPNGIQRLLYYTVGDYRIPASKPDFVYVNQLMQANALRLAVEHWISRMPDTSGALIWQWSDLWPSISWALMDFDKVMKPSYHYMKRSFQSPNAFAKIRPGEAEADVYLIHEKGDFSGKIVVEFYDVETGKVIKSEELEASGQGYQSTKAGRIAVGGFDPSRTVVLVHLYEGGQLLTRNSYLLGKPHQLKLKPAALQTETEAQADGTVKVTITAGAFAKDVWIPDIPFYLTDNGFDLLAGETKTVIIEGTLPEGTNVQPVCLNEVKLVDYI